MPSIGPASIGKGVGVGGGNGVVVEVGEGKAKTGIAGIPCSSVNPGMVQLKHRTKMIERIKRRLAITGFIIEDVFCVNTLTIYHLHVKL